MTDPRLDVPLYRLPEAARLAAVPVRTLANWVQGYSYPTQGGVANAAPVIRPTAGPGRDGLSFVNLVEVLALSGFRQSGVSMQKVRNALVYVRKEMQIDHPLASKRILTDGVDLFWRYQEDTEPEIHLVNITRGGQKAFPDAVERYLREVEWGRDQLAARWWPGARAGEGLVVVDPRRAFGAPVISGTGIRTEDVFARFSAGDSLATLMDDYGLTNAQIEAAIRAEARLLDQAA